MIFSGHFENGFPNGSVKTYYENSQLEFEGKMVEGIKEGEGIMYDNDGSKIYKGPFCNDKYHGKSGICYHKNGRKSCMGGFKKNHKNGHMREWHFNGILKFDGNYINGKKHGNGIEYHDNGVMVYQGGYRYEWPFGKNVSFFNKDGCCLFHGCTDSGKNYGYCVNYSQNGKKANMGIGVNKEGRRGCKLFEIEYWDNGQIKKIGDVKLQKNGKYPVLTRSEHLRDME